MQILEDKARQALIEELRRQAAEHPDRLTVEVDGEALRVNGDVDVDAIVMVIIGSVAGGP